jgi:hypothetical protein
MEIANVLQDEVIHRLGIVETEKGCVEKDVGVPCHAWYGQGQGRHVFLIRAKNPMMCLGPRPGG